MTVSDSQPHNRGQLGTNGDDPTMWSTGAAYRHDWSDILPFSHPEQRHYSDVTWSSWLLKLPAIKIFLQQLFQAIINKNIKALHFYLSFITVPLWGEMGQRKSFSSYDVIIIVEKNDCLAEHSREDFHYDWMAIQFYDVSSNYLMRMLYVRQLIMAWRRMGDMLLSEPMLSRFTDAYMRH